MATAGSLAFQGRDGSRDTRGWNRYTATAGGGGDVLKVSHQDIFLLEETPATNSTHGTWSELQLAKGFNNHRGKVRIKKYMPSANSAKEHLGNTNNKHD